MPNSKENKELHFQIPIKLWEEFYLVFPARGERRQILIAFIKEAIKLQSHKNNFVKLIGTNVAGRMKNGEFD